MATEQTPKRWIDEKSDRELDRDTAAAYAEVSKSNKSPVAALQKIGKLWLKWDSRPRPKTRARNALKQLVGVPADENGTWYFEQALRDALASAMNEESEFETDKWNEAAGDGSRNMERYGREKESNDRVRSIFRAAIRIDAGQEDINRVLRAIKKLEADDEAEAEEDSK
jgi:hypothetical protein